MPDKIVISGWYGYGNIGDEAILAALIELFHQQYGENCNVVVLSFRPKYTKLTHNVKAVDQLPSTFRGWIKSIITLRIFPTLIAMMLCDRFVLGGGGFLTDWQPEAPLQWLSQARLAKLFGKYTMLFGIGCGPFTTTRGKTITRNYINKYIDKVTVRDIYSYKALIDDVGVDHKKIEITQDPAFSLNIQNSQGITRKNIIGINLVELFKFRSFTGGEGKYIKYLNDLKELVMFLQLEFPNYELVFVPLFTKDSEFVYDSFHNDFPSIKVLNINNYQELIKCLYGLKFFIGTRFHSLVFAIKTDTPLFGLVYHPKSLAVCEEYQIPFDVINDGSFPPLENKDLELVLIEEQLRKLIP